VKYSSITIGLYDVKGLLAVLGVINAPIPLTRNESEAATLGLPLNKQLNKETVITQTINTDGQFKVPISLKSPSSLEVTPW
jgi:hypothetical protein